MVARLRNSTYTAPDLGNLKGGLQMQKWMSRFALLAVLGGLIASALVVGCGSPPEEPTSADANNAAKPAS
jgi:hypothetical protein